MEASRISTLMTTNIISVQPDCPLKQAVHIMQEQRISFLIIALHNKPVGVLSERDIVRLACQHADSERLQIQDVMTSPVITVLEDANIFQVYDTFNNKKIRHIVVVNPVGHIAGLATLTNILGSISIEYFVELKMVSNIMSQQICTLNPDNSLQQALELMSEKRISCIVITRDQQPVGIITERDITRLFSIGIVDDAPLASIMSTPVRTTGSNTFIPQANTIMQAEKLRHLVIVHADGSLAGLISQTDIARRIEEHYIGYLRSMLKQQDKKLRYEHERFSILFEQNPNAVISYDIEGKIVDINQAYVRLSGYTHDDVVGKALAEFIHPDDVETAKHAFKQASEDETTHGELRIRKKSGRVIHVFNSCLPIYADHSLHRIYSIMHDISDIKQAQQQVRNSEKKNKLLSQAVEQTRDSVMITNREGTIEFVNTAFTRITGYQAAEAVGHKPSILKSGEQDTDFYARMWSTISSGKPWQSRLIDRRKNGDFFPAELSISPVFNSQREITHYIGIKRDLTEREELEQQFHQAQKMEAIGTLVSGIAHDFNNMLAGMTGNLYMASIISTDNPEVLQKLSRVEQLTWRAAEMIQQLLTFARKGVVSMDKMPLIPFIKETIKFLQATVPENIAVHMEVDNETITIKGDTTQLHQVLMNLINNACDAVESTTSPAITIRLETFHPNKDFLQQRSYFKAGHYAHLSVKDNGCGIAEQQIQHLFEPFFTTKELGKGTGLGLSMVYGAVKTHQGFIDVQSTVGAGSTFHIYLPLIKEVDTVLASPPQQETVTGKHELILLADDDEHARETIAEVLESLNYRVLRAHNGQQAIDLFMQHRDDISMVLLDVIMPVLSGPEASLHIRQIKPELPVLFMTGYDNQHLLKHQEDIAPYTVLKKPLCLDTLSRHIYDVLN